MLKWILTAIIVPSFGHAACVSAEDVASGVRMVDGEGTVAVHQRGDGDIVRIAVDYGDGTGMQEERQFGLYPLTSMQTEDGAPGEGEDMAFTFTYESGLVGLEAPDALTELTIGSDMIFDTGQTAWVVTYRGGPQREITLGDCTYTVREISVEMRGPLGAPQLETYVWFIDLGLAHLAWSGVGTLEFPSPLVEMRAVE